MKLNLLLMCLAVFSASCSSFQEATSRKIAAISDNPDNVRDYQHVHETLAPLLSRTFSLSDTVNATESSCNAIGGGSSTRLANEAVLDKIAFLQSRVFAKCGKDCSGQIFTQLLDSTTCKIRVELTAPKLNPMQEKIKNLMVEQPANFFVFAAHASKTPIGACNSKGILPTIVGASTFQDVLDTVSYVRQDLQKKCGDDCRIAIDFNARNQIECIVTGVATPQ